MLYVITIACFHFPRLCLASSFPSIKNSDIIIYDCLKTSYVCLRYDFRCPISQIYMEMLKETFLLSIDQVLDEADRLLNEDFEKSLDDILKVIPRERRTYLFSATMTKKV